MRYACITAALACLVGLAGCRCCPCFNCYANVIDDVGDCDVLFDQWYHPRCDVSRAGRPDWCGPINRRLCHCRCEQGTWDRYDECWLYPPNHPYLYPARVLNQMAAPSDAPPQGTLPEDSPLAPLESGTLPANEGLLVPAPPPDRTIPPPPLPPESLRLRPRIQVQ